MNESYPQSFAEWILTYIKTDSGEIRQLKAGWTAGSNSRQLEIERLRGALRDCRIESDNKWHVHGIVDSALEGRSR